MTAEQSKIAEEMSKLQAELSALEAESPEGEDAIKAHSEQSERCIAALKGVTARANLANRLADARAAAEAVKPATNAAGVVVPAPAPAILKKEPSAKLTAGAVPSFLAPTKAYQVQCAPSKTAQQVVFTDEDLLRQEQEKREQVAAIRRKFKEQHKVLNRSFFIHL